MFLLRKIKAVGIPTKTAQLTIRSLSRKLRTWLPGAMKFKVTKTRDTVTVMKATCPGCLIRSDCFVPSKKFDENLIKIQI